MTTERDDKVVVTGRAGPADIEDDYYSRLREELIEDLLEFSHAEDPSRTKKDDDFLRKKYRAYTWDMFIQQMRDQQRNGFRTELLPAAAPSGEQRKEYIDDARAEAQGRLIDLRRAGSISQPQWEAVSKWLDGPDGGRELARGWTSEGRIEPVEFVDDVLIDRLEIAVDEIDEARIKSDLAAYQAQREAVDENFTRVYDERVLQPLRNIIDGTTPSTGEMQDAAAELLLKVGDAVFIENTRKSFINSLEEGRGDFEDPERAARGAISSSVWGRTLAPVDFLEQGGLGEIMERAFPKLGLDAFGMKSLQDGLEKLLIPARAIETKGMKASARLENYFGSIVGRIEGVILDENSSADRRKVYEDLLEALYENKAEYATQFEELGRQGSATTPMQFLNSVFSDEVSSVLVGSEAEETYVPGDIIKTLGNLTSFEFLSEKVLRAETTIEKMATDIFKAVTAVMPKRQRDLLFDMVDYLTDNSSDIADRYRSDPLGVESGVSLRDFLNTVITSELKEIARGTPSEGEIIPGDLFGTIDGLVNQTYPETTARGEIDLTIATLVKQRAALDPSSDAFKAIDEVISDLETAIPTLEEDVIRLGAGGAVSPQEAANILVRGVLSRRLNAYQLAQWEQEVDKFRAEWIRDPDDPTQRGLPPRMDQETARRMAERERIAREKHLIDEKIRAAAANLSPGPMPPTPQVTPSGSDIAQEQEATEFGTAVEPPATGMTPGDIALEESAQLPPGMVAGRPLFAEDIDADRGALSGAVPTPQWTPDGAPPPTTEFTPSGVFVVPESTEWTPDGAPPPQWEPVGIPPSKGKAPAPTTPGGAPIFGDPNAVEGGISEELQALMDESARLGALLGEMDADEGIYRFDELGAVDANLRTATSNYTQSGKALADAEAALARATQEGRGAYEVEQAMLAVNNAKAAKAEQERLLFSAHSRQEQIYRRTGYPSPPPDMDSTSIDAGSVEEQAGQFAKGLGGDVGTKTPGLDPVNIWDVTQEDRKSEVEIGRERIAALEKKFGKDSPEVLRATWRSNLTRDPDNILQYRGPGRIDVESEHRAILKQREHKAALAETFAQDVKMGGRGGSGRAPNYRFRSTEQRALQQAGLWVDETPGAGTVKLDTTPGGTTLASEKARLSKRNKNNTPGGGV